MDGMLKRAKYLVLNGRFQNQVSKMSERFEIIEEGETIKIGTERYTPYLDTKTKQIVYGRIENDKIYYLTFSNADYTYGVGDTFEWFDV